MPNIDLIRASDGTGDATVATFTANRSVSATTCQVDSVAGYPQDFIATSGTPNVDTGIIESNIQVFTAHLSGSDIVIDDFAPGYSDTGNQVGDIIVLKPTTRTQDEIADVLEVSHNDDGTLNSVAMTQIASDSAVKAAIASERRIPRLRVQSDVSTLSPNIDDYNYERVTGLTQAITVANPTGTPNDGDGLLIEITGTAARAITWGSNYEANSQYGLTLPTTTVTTKTTFITFVYDDDTSKWRMVG